jgi:hypothetical protein
MKRAGALLLLAFAVVWAAALFDVRGAAPAAAPSKPEPTAPERAGAPAAPPAELLAAEPAEVEEAAPAAAPAPVEVARDAHPAPAGFAARVERAVEGGFALIGKLTGKPAHRARAKAPEPAPQPRKPAPEGTGELGEGLLSPEFVEYEQNYAREARDGEWAEAEEQRLRDMLDKEAWSDEVGLVHCQQTLCRIVLETDVDARNAFQQLIGVPGLREATGLGPDTPYSLRSGQLSVYFRARAGAAAL